MERPADNPRASSTCSDLVSVRNPATGEEVGTVPLGNSETVDMAVQQALLAFPGWATKDPVDRGKILYGAAQLVRNRVDDLARLLTCEQGKPLKEAKNEITGFARILEYYASISGQIRGDYGHSSAYGHAIVSRKPLGVCSAIIPWNVPGIIMGWKIGPALTSGNTLLVKPATTAPLTCIRLAGCLADAGLPPHVLQVITGTGPVVGEALVTHPDIRAISFTGEVETGRRVSSLAAPSFKRVTLELGGSDPMIVCRDADLIDAAKGAVAGRFYNCGQTCTAVKRLFVDQSIAEEFIRKLTLIIQELQIGNGLSSGMDMGPIHTGPQRDIIMDQIRRTIEGGQGKVVNGGKVPESDVYRGGFFFEPTLIADLDPEAPVLKEEVFGPVLPVMSYDTLDTAIQAANDARFGLGASVWTHDTRIVSRVCGELEAGIVWVNQHLKIPPEVPFGGTKNSGIGRENGRYALDHYLEDKTVLIKP